MAAKKYIRFPIKDYLFLRDLWGERRLLEWADWKIEAHQSVDPQGRVHDMKIEYRDLKAEYEAKLAIGLSYHKCRIPTIGRFFIGRMPNCDHNYRKLKLYKVEDVEEDE